MRKIILVTISACLIIGSFILIRTTKKSSHTHGYTIGILQTASHPALDAARDGFIQELNNLLGNTVSISIHNAQGSIPQAHAIAQQLHADKSLHAFYAIATPAAQALGSIEKERPVIVAAVTDPDSLGLIHPKTNICGTKDMLNVKAIITLIRTLVPDAKTVGLLYTTGEVNSQAAVRIMKQEIERAGLSAVDFGISQELELAGLVELACRKVDVILAPNDNIIATSISLISVIATKHHVPLFVSDPMLVAFGPLAAQGINYFTSGAQAAHIAHQILVYGKKAYELPIEQSAGDAIVINRKTLNILGLIVPDNLKDRVTLV